MRYLSSFGEYVCIPQSNVIVIPYSIPVKFTSIFDLLGNAVHTVLSFSLVGEDVLVYGAGLIGIMEALVARHYRARKGVITDINPVRLDITRKMGIDFVVNTTEEKLSDVMNNIGMTEGFDVGLVMSSAAIAFRDMIDKMNNCGKIAISGIAPAAFEVDWNKVICKMLNLKGIYGREMFKSWHKMIVLWNVASICCDLLRTGLRLTILKPDLKTCFREM